MVQDYKTKNSLISNFMNLKQSTSNGFSYSDGVNTYLTDKGLLYHTSWDWLMPVMKEIRRVLMKELGEYYGDWMTVIEENLTTMDFARIYNIAIEFIEWYNKQK